MMMLWILWASLAGASPLEEGAALLGQGDVDAAVALWEPVPADERSGQLDYDLAIARYMQGDLARSIGHLRAALRHRPRDADAHHNLAFVRSKLEPVPPPVGDVRVWMSVVTPNELGIAGLTLAFGAWVLGWRRRRAGEAGRAMGELWALWAFGLTLSAVAMEGQRAGDRHPVAVVVDAETAPRDTPHVEGDRLFALGVGSEVRIVAQRANWCLIEDGRERRGWVSTGTLMSAGLANTVVDD